MDLPREAKRKRLPGLLTTARGQREAAGQRPLAVERSQPEALGTEQGFISALGVP